MSCRTISVLGSTGSVGCSTLDVLRQVRETGQFEFRVEALTANRNAAQLAEQARIFGASIAVVSDESALPELRALLDGTGIEAAGGRSALIEAAARSASSSPSARRTGTGTRASRSWTSRASPGIIT